MSITRIIYADSVPAAQTVQECDFIETFMPVETHGRLLDMACESGRHSLVMASRGYVVTGIDIDPRALQVARERSAELGVEVEFIEADLRDLQSIEATYDGIILFWQSFGFFNNEAQSGLFIQIHRLLRAGGILMLDVFNRHYYTRAANPTSPFASGLMPRPTVWGEIERITSMLGYEEDRSLEERRMVDLLDPHLFTLGEIAGIAHNHGLHLLQTSCNYSPDYPATAEHPKMQLVFKRL